MRSSKRSCSTCIAPTRAPPASASASSTSTKGCRSGATGTSRWSSARSAPSRAPAARPVPPTCARRSGDPSSPTCGRSVRGSDGRAWISTRSTRSRAEDYDRSCAARTPPGGCGLRSTGSSTGPAPTCVSSVPAPVGSRPSSPHDSASVQAFDRSPSMLRVARQTLGHDSRRRRARRRRTSRCPARHPLGRRRRRRVGVRPLHRLRADGGPTHSTRHSPNVVVSRSTALPSC